MVYGTMLDAKCKLKQNNKNNIAIINEIISCIEITIVNSKGYCKKKWVYLCKLPRKMIRTK
jgi:hypothetical protein